MRVFHGTTPQAAAAILRDGFRLDAADRRDPGDLGEAVYLTTSRARAEACGRAVLEVTLELKRPLKLSHAAAYALVIDELGFDTIHGYGSRARRVKDAQEARRHFLEEGHDALLAERDGETEVAVYDLGAIKIVKAVDA